MSRLRMVLWRKTRGCWWTNNLRWTSNVDLQPGRLTISWVASVNIGQASARRSDFCLLALAKVMTHLFQTFYQFFIFLHLFRVKFQSTGSARYSRCLPISSLPLITVLPGNRSLGGILKQLLNHKKRNTFRRCSNRNMFLWMSQGYSNFSRAFGTSLEEKGDVKEKGRVEKQGKVSPIVFRIDWPPWGEKVRSVTINSSWSMEMTAMLSTNTKLFSWPVILSYHKPHLLIQSLLHCLLATMSSEGALRAWWEDWTNTYNLIFLSLLLLRRRKSLKNKMCFHLLEISLRKVL